MENQVTFAVTKDTPAATKYRGQRYIVLSTLQDITLKTKKPVELENLVTAVSAPALKYHDTFKVNNGKFWTDEVYGGVRGSILYHLKALVKAGELKQEGVIPQMKRKATPKPEAPQGKQKVAAAEKKAA